MRMSILFFLFIFSCGKEKTLKESANQKFYSTEFHGISCIKCLILDSHDNQLSLTFNNHINNCVGKLTFKKDDKMHINLKQDLDIVLNETENRAISCQNDSLRLTKKGNKLTLDGVDIYTILEEK